MSFTVKIAGHIEGDAEAAAATEGDILNRVRDLVAAVDQAYPGAITDASFKGSHTGADFRKETPGSPVEGSGGDAGAGPEGFQPVDDQSGPTPVAEPTPEQRAQMEHKGKK